MGAYRIYISPHPSHSETSRLLTSSLSLGVPVPRHKQQTMYCVHAAVVDTDTVYMQQNSSVADSMVAFTPTPTPRSRSSISPTHNIHTHTLPTPTLLTFTSTEVLWFLPCLTRPRASGVPLDPVQVLLSFLPVQPSVYESFRFLRFNVLNITYQ